MKKGQVIGLVVTGLAIIGGVAVYNWVRKPKKNSDGFFNASGTSKMATRHCYCKSSDGTLYISDGERCKGSDRCVAHTGVY